MEHEVFVPVPVDDVRRALTEPARIARCLPGLQQDDDAGSDAIAGRLRLRIGGSSITYRGVLHIAEHGDRVEYAGDGAESRGGAGVTVTLAVAPQATDGGTTLRCAGEVELTDGEGRLTEFDAETVASAARRLLDRFAEELAADLAAEPTPTAPATADDATEAGATADTDADADGEAEAGAPDGPAGSPGSAEGAPAAAPGGKPDDVSRDDAASGDAPGDDLPGDDATADELSQDDVSGDAVSGDAGVVEQPADATASSLFETEVPPSSLEPDALGGSAAAAEVPPAEAAHARRTMIGRSAEEVDHAPPRGRYAPVPAPETASTVATLRWAAPAAAAVLASAVVVGRVLRRRR
ncbi:carbon monoxide dehydrogenase [Streptomyces sp. AC536]|uniref:CoxG family protein n=1 Tax=Streptomyces buecherae TaxID=2763006 RepID=UPI00164EBBCA|nr:SRPBCC domain-containing protein [Streptomyces buecherae]MBC3982693.1 carbon monoxide dehydrogenase [Streptomyces buecherae]QNJ40949.1 carbon monoxide dehydrogenase [Streptomyces buecherae]